MILAIPSHRKGNGSEEAYKYVLGLHGASGSQQISHTKHFIIIFCTQFSDSVEMYEYQKSG